MTILITGGTGFIGSRIAKKLVDRGAHVVCFDYAPDPAVIDGYQDRIKICKGDVCTIETLISAMKDHQVESVIHLAYVLELESMFDPHTAVKVNCIGTNNILEAARIMEIRRLIFASSITAYGHHEKHGAKVLNEDDPLYPESVYGACKAFSEFMTTYYRNLYGMDNYVLRVGSAFGPGRTQGATAFVSNITTLPALGQPLAIPLKASTHFVYSSADDVAEAFVKVCQADASTLNHSVYNIGGHTHTGEEVAACIRGYIPDARITFGEMEVYYVYRLDNSRLCEDTGFKLTPLKEGIKHNINEARLLNKMAPIP